MLLRLRIKGFKNLRDVDIRLGPITCFVGPNGVGKSNIFDAIQFLRHLADEEFQRAGERVRGPATGSYSPLELFWNNDPKGQIEFEADFLAPLKTLDDFGQSVEPSITLLKYSVRFGFESKPRPRLVLRHEDLRHNPKSEARELIGFKHTPAFRQSVVTGKRFGKAFISTSDEEGVLAVSLHGDGGSRGRPVPAAPSPRTVLAGTGAAEYPTVIAARREMASWHALHLEPSSLRTPDQFGSPATVNEHGRYIAATLDRLARSEPRPGSVWQECANKLAMLAPEVQSLRVDRDEVRQQLVVQIKMHGSDLWLSPRSLSDGTLRFLALATMQLDAESARLLCMEEPENGIHPYRVPALIDLLRDYVVDPRHAIGEDNPSRQVVLNSHSPQVVKQLQVPELLFVDSVHGPAGREAAIRPVLAEGNWRGAEGGIEPHRLVELIGGCPMSPVLSKQLVLPYSTAQ